MTLTFDTTPLIGPNTLDRLCVRAMTKPPDEIIEDRYLRRWHFVRGSTLSLYLHLYVGGDPCARPHDLPGEHLEAVRIQVGLRLDADREGPRFPPGRRAGARGVPAPGFPVLSDLPEHHPGKNAVPALHRARIP